MTSTERIEKKKETSILHRFVKSDASPLYHACQAGDVNYVRELVSSLNYSDINHRELNGSTALHAASLFGHVDIVRILLHERGVMRHRRNRDKMTAFEVAANDEIRQLFIRPSIGPNRFCNDDNCNNQKQFLTVINSTEQDSDNNKDDDENTTQRKWIDSVADENYIQGLLTITAVGKFLLGSPLARSITFATFNHLLHDQFSPYENEASVRDFLLHLIDTHVTRSHPQYDKACELVNKFARKKRIEPLLRLYTLETPLYHQLHYESDAWLLPLICHFANLKPRFFQGTSYRGLSMKSQELRVYQSASGKTSCIIRTNTFCSTSSDRHVAENFLNVDSESDLIHALMIFEFPFPCDLAIQLYAISDKYPCLSDFEDEKEVLLLPQTLFHVKRIDNDDKQHYATIWLEHVPPDQHPLRAYIRHIARNIQNR
ncbi:unnamed protein product [Rotaria sp. Silwood2]|nr:unnamed protein product [Rotaria sp. Silwood2]CAF4089723.1 unnamed protein product [Rotaria sp. Silwood2]